jgi:hypothetical protein
MPRQIGMKMGTGITMVITEEAWCRQAGRIKRMKADNRSLTKQLGDVVEKFEAAIKLLGDRVLELESIVADQRERIVDYQMREEMRAERGTHAA